MGRRPVPVLVVALVGAAVLAALAPSALGAQRRIPTLAPQPTVVDGPSAAITSLGGLAVARDGEGGLVYLKGAHVFVSRLLNGSFQPPQQADAGLAGPSSQPVIAAASGGLLTVAFINGATLYVIEATGPSAPLSGPRPLYGPAAGNGPGAAAPALSMSNLGKGYVAFTSVGSGADHVLSAYYYQGQWSLETAWLDANPTAGSAGAATGRPSVVAAGDGIGIVAWGESGHVYLRRVWGTQPDPTFLQADTPSLSGFPETSADEPSVSAGGQSSYVAVAFRERFSNGQTRVLVNHTTAELTDGVFGADGITSPSGDSADQPQLAVNEYGRGWATSQDTFTHVLTGAALSTNDTPTLTLPINAEPDTVPPDAVPAVAGIVSTFIVWQQAPGAAGPADIRLRYAADGYDLASEEVISSPADGPADAAAGLAAGGDLAGDAAAAWVQGSAGQSEIVANQLYQAPGGFSATSVFRYARVVDPALSWNPASELWGPLRYTVTLDGAPVAETSGTIIRTPVIGQGPHVYLVTATNQGGVSTPDRPATVFVDTIPPRASIRLRGRRSPGFTIHLLVRAGDVPRGLPRADASGVRSIQVRWGDGRRGYARSGRARHVYRRGGRFTITVTVADRAGNHTTIRKRVRIGRGGGGRRVRRRRARGATLRSPSR